MHLIRRILILGALCAFLVPATASAAGDFDRFGPYVGINAAWGYALFEDEVQSATGDPNASLDPSWGLNTRLGLRLFSFLALEGQYEWMDDFAISSTAGNASVNGNTFTGNVKLYIPVWRVQPYFLAGIGFTRYRIEGGGQSIKQELFAGRLGGGADIYLTEKVALNAEVAALLTANDLEFNGDSFSSLNYLSVSLGLMYRF